MTTNPQLSQTRPNLTPLPKKLPPPCYLNPRNINLHHFHHRVEHPLGGGAVRIGQRLGQRARRDLPAQAPLILAPAAGAGLAAVADDGLPQAVGFGLILGGHLKGEGFAVLEGGTAVKTQARDAQHGEFHGEHIALLAGRVVAGRAQHCADAAVREGGGIEARGVFGVAVVPQADGVFVHGPSSGPLICRWRSGKMTYK